MDSRIDPEKQRAAQARDRAANNRSVITSYGLTKPEVPTLIQKPLNPEPAKVLSLADARKRRSSNA